MSLTTRRGPLVIGSILLAVSCFGFLLGAGLPKDSIYRYLNVFAEVYSLVRGNYVDPPDEDNLLDGCYVGYSSRSYQTVPDNSSKVVTIRNNLWRLQDMPTLVVESTGNK